MEFLQTLISKEPNSSRAIEKLQSEHTSRKQHMKELEARLEQIQGQLQTKLKALDAIQDKNASLLEEISTLRNSFGCFNGIEAAQCQLPSAPPQFQHTSENKANISAKPSEKVLYSRFMPSTSTVSLLPGKSSSRMVRFPVCSSLLTLDKKIAPSSSSFLLQKQFPPCSSISSFGNDALGQGQDYIKSLFADTKKTTLEPGDKAGKMHVPPEYYNSSASSAVGNLKIVEVHSHGYYVKILNSSPNKEEGIGDYTLQQNFGGHPIAIFKFPPKIRMKANSSVTVWAADSKRPSKPPTDYLWKDLDKFKAGPECTTILCNPSGQAVAWFTPINWNQKQTKEGEEGGRICRNLIQPIIGMRQQKDRWQPRTFDKWQGNVGQNLTGTNEPEFILREEKKPPILYPVQSSWCQNPSSPTHPHYTVGRYILASSDGSHLSRQMRTQLVKHDPDTGLLCPGSSYSIKPAGDGNRKNRIRPTRSAGPNLGGVIYIGSAAPIGSALQKYFAHSSCNFRLLAQTPLTPINFL
ncbi:lamin tail domain-containing protein 1 [Lacerta agilis]|uniref:lamin tail domain-containing protein 1 n=1 Tax=Lacerta agilis TaxID=80427 RepID=UPI0014191AEE|nr:lamin tail domain-containing protein 1 [Lacerta agilis]